MEFLNLGDECLGVSNVARYILYQRLEEEVQESRQSLCGSSTTTDDWADVYWALVEFQEKICPLCVCVCTSSLRVR